MTEATEIERLKARVQVYDLSDPSLMAAVIHRLEVTPADQWPDLELHHNMLISVRLRQMELAEIEARAALSKEPQS